MAYEIQNNKQKVKFSVAIQSDGYKKMINNTLGDPTQAKKFIANITSAVSVNPKLQECEPGSIISAGLVANSLNLPINQSLGFAYILPYENKRTGITSAQFQVGYKGLIQLALRSGQYQKIGCKMVHEGEIQGQDEFGDEIIKFDHKFDTKPVVGYYAYFKLTNGAVMTSYKTKEECERHGRKYSKAFNKLWTTDFDTMAMKTTLKLLLSKYGIMSTEIQDAIKYDQAVINKGVNGDEFVDYIDNPNSKGPIEYKTEIIDEPVEDENGEIIDEDFDPISNEDDAAKLQKAIDEKKKNG